jgi:hypothetical protein
MPEISYLQIGVFDVKIPLEDIVHKNTECRYFDSVPKSH